MKHSICLTDFISNSQGIINIYNEISENNVISNYYLFIRKK